MDPVILFLVMIAVPAAFALSASAGMGGSLIMVPTLVLLLGAKQGVAVAALLLAANNITKAWAYRRSLPFVKAAAVVVLLMLGSALGAGLMVGASESVVEIGVVVAFAASLAAELVSLEGRRSLAGLMAFGAGATSGFSGTSGPLKGTALRSLDLDRQHLVGAAALASLAGDASKTAVFSEAGLLGPTTWIVTAALVPVMIASTIAGRSLNARIGERGYALLFWAVVVGYSGRLLVWG